MKLYGQLFYLLHGDTKYIAKLVRLVKIDEIDDLLQPVMFSLFGYPKMVGRKRIHDEAKQDIYFI